MIKASPFQWAAFNFFGFFCAYGVILPFLPVWLKFHGYSTETIGLLAAFGYLFRFAGGMFSSQWAKEPARLIPTVRILTVLNIATLAAIAWSAESFRLLFPVLMLFHVFNAGAMPIGDSIASLWQKRIGLDYGKARLFGSIAFVVGSLSTGYLVDVFGEASIIRIIASFFILLGCGQMLTPTQQIKIQEKNTTAPQLSYRQILQEGTTWRILLAVALITGSHAAYYTYSTIHWSAAGISTRTSSFLWGTAVCAEILFFLFSGRFFKAWRIRHLIIAACIATVVRWSVLASTAAIIPLLLSQTLHALTFGMTHYAMIRYISLQSAEKITKLQGLYFALSSCGFMALFTFISGLVYQHQPHLAFWLMALAAATAMLIVPKKFEVNLR